MAENEEVLPVKNKYDWVLSSRFGETSELSVSPIIEEKFNELNFSFRQVSHNHRFFENGKSIAEIDIMLENGDTVMINNPQGFTPREW